MRSLVREISGKRSVKGKARDFGLRLLGQPTRAQRLESDSSRQRVNVVALLVLIVLLVALFAAYKLALSPSHQADVRQWRTLLIAIGIPILLATVGGSLVAQSVSRSVATTDGFSGLLQSLLDDRDMQHSKKIVVFVDDLDRVSAQMARDVLDSLRTFFDQPALSFVVAGDHTVLERILGRELLPDGKLPVQLDEGRRFLKKVFNVYWRLPLPVEQEFERLLEGLLAERRDRLSMHLASEDIDRLRQLLSLYFEKNIRAVSRFVDEFIFTMEAVDVRLQAAADDAGLADLKAHPLLVVRVLMMQENCSPFFEAVLRDPRLLNEIEVAIDRQEAEPLDRWVSANTDMLAPRHERFLRLFIYEKPRFFEDSVLTVSGLEPFLYLAADGAEDDRGVTPEDFARLVAMGNASEVTRVLVASGNKRIVTAAAALQSQFDSGLEDTEILKQVVTVVQALQGLPTHHPAHSVLSSLVLSKQATVALQAIPIEQYVEMFLTWRKWLDAGPEDVDAESFVPAFPYRGDAAVNLIPAEAETPDGLFSHFGSRVAVTWTDALYRENHAAGVSTIYRLTNVLLEDVLHPSVAAIAPQMVADLLDDNLPPEVKNQALELLSAATEDGAMAAKASVLEAIEQMRPTTWDWALATAGSAYSPWSGVELETSVIDAAVKCDSAAALVATLRYACGRVTSQIDFLWARLMDDKPDLLPDVAASVATDRSLAPLAPSGMRAAQLFVHLNEDAKLYIDAPARASAIRLLGRGMWMWDNYAGRPDLRSVSGMRRYRKDPGVAAAVTEVLDSWKT